MIRKSVVIPAIAVLVSALLQPSEIQAKGIYKLYTFTVSRGSVVSYVDPSFTLLFNDTTQCSVEFPDEDGSRAMMLRVWRDVAQGESAPSINVNKIRVRGYNAAGNQIYSVKVDGFAFAREESDEWIYKIEAIPKKTVKLTILFTGRFEN
jgi:hypothetical protein